MVNKKIGKLSKQIDRLNLIQDIRRDKIKKLTPFTEKSPGKRLRKSPSLKIQWLFDSIDNLQAEAKATQEQLDEYVKFKDNFDKTPLGKWLEIRIPTAETIAKKSNFEQSNIAKFLDAHAIKVAEKADEGVTNIKELVEPPKPEDMPKPKVEPEVMKPRSPELDYRIKNKDATAQLEMKYKALKGWEVYKDKGKVPIAKDLGLNGSAIQTVLDNDLVEHLFNGPIKLTKAYAPKDAINVVAAKLKKVGISDTIIK